MRYRNRVYLRAVRNSVYCLGDIQNSLHRYYKCTCRGCILYWNHRNRLSNYRTEDHPLLCMNLLLRNAGNFDRDQFKTHRNSQILVCKRIYLADIAVMLSILLLRACRMRWHRNIYRRMYPRNKVGLPHLCTSAL